MTESRRQKIEAMLESEPNDTFLRYSLAMEMSAEGEVDSALEEFAKLCHIDPPHVPAFFRSAQLLAERDDFASARDYLRRGIEEARQQNDLHAAAEMSEMLSDLGIAGE